MSRRAAIGAVTALLLAPGYATPSSGQTMRGMAAPAVGSDRVSVQGRVAHPRVFTVADLKRLAPTTVALSDATGHGPRQASYTGALLWTLLADAGLADEPGPKTSLRHVFLARGSDGYTVALAMGELDPTFEGKRVIVAYAEDGAVTDLRLVVPGDRRAGRNVKDLVSIEVR